MCAFICSVQFVCVKYYVIYMCVFMCVCVRTHIHTHFFVRFDICMFMYLGAHTCG